MCHCITTLGIQRTFRTLLRSIICLHDGNTAFLCWAPYVQATCERHKLKNQRAKHEGSEVTYMDPSEVVLSLQWQRQTWYCTLNSFSADSFPS